MDSALQMSAGLLVQTDIHPWFKSTEVPCTRNSWNTDRASTGQGGGQL